MLACLVHNPYVTWLPPALTMLKELVSIAHIATDLHASKQAISDLKQAISDLKQATTGLPCQPEKREQGRRKEPLMELMQYGIEM